MVEDLPERQRQALTSWVRKQGRRKVPQDPWPWFLKLWIRDRGAAALQLQQQGSASAQADEQKVAFAAGMAVLRWCDQAITVHVDADRQQELWCCLASQLEQIVKALHRCLVPGDASHHLDGEGLWQGWELLRWRESISGVALPAEWPLVREFLLRQGALAWAQRARVESCSDTRRIATSRALTLLQAMQHVLEPVPGWMALLQEQLVRLGLADLQEHPVGEGESLRQAARALAQAQQEGTGVAARAAAQQQAGLAETLLLAGLKEEGLSLLAALQPAWVAEEERKCRARLLAGRMLLGAGLWKETESLLREAVRAIDPEQLEPQRLAAELQILRTENELLAHELSLALRQGALEPRALASEASGREHWQHLSCAQLGQDLWVLEQLGWKRDGFFVEFGATDGVLLSNSLLLEKHFGWRGICAEPNPRLFQRLQQNRTCILSPACVYRSSGERMRFVLADAFGGLEDLGQDDQHVDKRKAYAAVGDLIEVTTTSLMDLLAQHDAPAVIDYLSIDTEGSELVILEGVDWNRYQFRCITVEHNFTDQRQGIQMVLEAQGYQRQEAQWDDWYWKQIP